MKIHFGGVRGTAPRADPRFREFGGHTTCLLITGVEHDLLLLDAGSGAQAIYKYLPDVDDARRRLLVMLTHLHLDHILGLPMLLPLGDPKWKIEIAAVPPKGLSLDETLKRMISPPLWPVTLQEMPADTSLHEISAAEREAGLSHGGLTVRGVPVPHPNGCTAWRVDEAASGQAFVFATDIEWGQAGPKHREALLALCREPSPAQLLIMDGHFTAEELEKHVGWGHSSLDECVEVARTAGVHRLLVTHHGPDNDDVRLREIETELQAIWSEAKLARQDQELDLEELDRD